MSEPEQVVSRWLSPTVTSEILVGVVIALFLVFLLVFFFYLYTKRYSGAVPTIRSSRTRFILPADHPAGAARGGLDPQVLRALPVTVFRSGDFKENSLECAVCLTEVSDGEEARLLPKCSHGFHVDCIDMWFHSHNTCPLCRFPVSLPEPSKGADFCAHSVDIPPAEVAGDRQLTEPSNFPSNVLVWGSRDRVSTGAPVAVCGGRQEGSSSSSSAGSSSGKAEGMLVIEIPRRAAGGFASAPSSPLPMSRPAVEETKSPMSARLRSLRRLWSRGVGAMRSPRGGGDVEQGGDGSRQVPTNP